MEVKYKIFTYGCQMNVHDSERIAGALEQHGFSATDSECEADIIVFNTCCIRHTAEKRILGNIGDIKHLKKKNKNLIVAVAGCMTQQEGVPESLRTQFPFVDVCAGTGKAVEFADKIKAVYDSVVSETKRGFHNLPADLSSESVCEGEPVARTSFPHAWINIIYGCDNFCSYCIVPFVRGRERSRAPEAILQEVEGLLKAGYTKITLLGQNVNSYSYENDSGKWDFAMLLEAVASLNYNFTVGFMTSHPKDFSDNLISVISANERVEKKIHLPVQSGSNRILEAMNRGYTREKYFDIISKIRAGSPNTEITTDIMVGFPNETEEDFLFTVDLVEKVRFLSAFTFVFSPRKGTVASNMPQLPYAIKKARIVKLIALQNKITKEITKERSGK